MIHRVAVSYATLTLRIATHSVDIATFYEEHRVSGREAGLDHLVRQLDFFLKGHSWQ